MLQGKIVSPPEKTPLVELSNEMKSKVIGDYLVKPGDTLKVFEENGCLFQQENVQVKHELFPYDSSKFSFEFLEFNAYFEDEINDKMQTLKFETSQTILTAKRILLH